MKRVRVLISMATWSYRDFGFVISDMCPRCRKLISVDRGMTKMRKQYESIEFVDSDFIETREQAHRARYILMSKEHECSCGQETERDN